MKTFSQFWIYHIQNTLVFEIVFYKNNFKELHSLNIIGHAYEDSWIENKCARDYWGIHVNT